MTDPRSPSRFVEHYKKLDPGNSLDPGIGHGCKYACRQ